MYSYQTKSMSEKVELVYAEILKQIVEVIKKRT
jgi:hypothetical protein